MSVISLILVVAIFVTPWWHIELRYDFVDNCSVNYMIEWNEILCHADDLCDLMLDRPCQSFPINWRSDWRSNVTAGKSLFEHQPKKTAMIYDISAGFTDSNLIVKLKSFH